MRLSLQMVRLCARCGLGPTFDFSTAALHPTARPKDSALQINGNDTTFESPSAFSIFLKRMVNPNRKADDGWKTVKFNGKFLETYKMQLAKQRLAGGAACACAVPAPCSRLLGSSKCWCAAAEEDGEAASDAPPAAKKAKLEAGTASQGKLSQKPKAARKAANGHASSTAQGLVGCISQMLEESWLLCLCLLWSGGWSRRFLDCRRSPKPRLGATWKTNIR